MSNFISDNKKQLILELYFCSNDRRFKVIAEIVGSNQITVSNIIQEYFDKKIEFERGNYRVLHSSINNFN
jgi:hypothetical protein